MFLKLTDILEVYLGGACVDIVRQLLENSGCQGQTSDGRLDRQTSCTSWSPRPIFAGDWGGGEGVVCIGGGGRRIGQVCRYGRRVITSAIDTPPTATFALQRAFSKT